ncbi:MAG: hypothetical protein A2Y97_10765 [Nitrospirae bacterium RBG_13_39_12]|nr:MAG: hypothetical protein A2Y97_10765 [Nitrospirae bacterium RBG_13_39_12]
MLALAFVNRKLLITSAILLVLLVPAFAWGESDRGLSAGETLYVPVYSNVYSGPKANPLQLATMLSIHNIDPKYSITMLKADYYDSNGRFVESYVKSPVTLNPFAHAYFYLKEYDKRGGPGANFIVKWRAEKKVNQPIVEALMLGVREGVSFLSTGHTIIEHGK